MNYNRLSIGNELCSFKKATKCPHNKTRKGSGQNNRRSNSNGMGCSKDKKKGPNKANRVPNSPQDEDEAPTSGEDNSSGEEVPADEQQI